MPLTYPLHILQSPLQEDDFVSYLASLILVLLCGFLCPFKSLLKGFIGVIELNCFGLNEGEVRSIGLQEFYLLMDLVQPLVELEENLGRIGLKAGKGLKLV